MRGDRVPMVVTLRALLAAVLSICRNFPGGEAIWLSIPESGTKCISEELHSNVVVLGDYTVVSESHIQTDPTIAVKVTSPYGNILHRTENVTDGQFAFTTREAGSYLACFSMVTNGGFTGAPTSVNVDWKNGITTKDWESVAKREKLEGVEFELKRLEGAVDAIHDNLMHLITREADMRRVSEATNAKVAWLSLFSLGACLAVSTLQVLYLKQFFRRKKLI